MVAGNVRDGTTIRVDVANDDLTVAIEAPQAEAVVA
jgi:hypothetical protein